MAVLVTGGAGYIGSHTVIELLDENKDIIIVDNFYNSNPIVLDRIREISGKDFKFYKIPSSDYAQYFIYQFRPGKKTAYR